MVGGVWAAAPLSTHSALTRLRGTWSAIFPAEVLQAVDLRAQQVKTAQALLQKQRAARAAVPAAPVPALAPPAAAMPYPVAGLSPSVAPAGALFQGPTGAAAAFPGLPPHAYGPPPLLPGQFAPPPAAYGGAYGVALPQPYPPGPAFLPAGGHFPPSGALPAQQPQQHAVQPSPHLQGAPGVGGVLSSLLGGLPSHLTSSSGQPSSSHAAHPAAAAPPVPRPAARASSSSARENVATTHFEPVFMKARARHRSAALRCWPPPPPPLPPPPPPPLPQCLPSRWARRRTRHCALGSSRGRASGCRRSACVARSIAEERGRRQAVHFRERRASVQLPALDGWRRRGRVHGLRRAVRFAWCARACGCTVAVSKLLPCAACVPVAGYRRLYRVRRRQPHAQLFCPPSFLSRAARQLLGGRGRARIRAGRCPAERVGAPARRRPDALLEKAQRRRCSHWCSVRAGEGCIVVRARAPSRVSLFPASCTHGRRTSTHTRCTLHLNAERDRGRARH